MSISISIPAKKSTSAGNRGTKTISPNIAFLNVVLLSLNGTAQPADGPYNTLVPVSQLGGCSRGGRANARAAQSVSGCYTVTVPAPVGDAVYAIGAVDSGMTLLDYADNVHVTVDSGATATLSATLNGVGATPLGQSVPCGAPVVQYDASALCAYAFDLADNSADDMAAGAAGTGYLANKLSFTATDMTTHQPLNIAHDAAPDPATVVNQIDFDPAFPDVALTGTTLNAGRLGTYATAIRPDLSEIPSGATDIVEFKAVLQPPATTAFGPNVLMPHAAPATFTWDLPCKNVTVGASDPSGVAEGTVMQFCDLPSNTHLVVR